MKIKNTTKRSGFTLVEILVVLVIATVVLSIAVPRIRSINKERNIREAARVVGSALANASQRAAVDGIAGIRITRNPNMIQGTQQFAANQISLLRAVPNYTGDVQNATIQVVDADSVSIPTPIEQRELGLIQRGDLISFNNSSIKYRITNNPSGNARLTLDLDLGQNNYMPMPNDGDAFVIHRLPRPLRSSRATLPDSYIVDLRFSGFEVLDNGDAAGGIPPQLTTIFEPVLTETTPVTVNYDIEIIFDEEGAIDQVFYKNPDTNETIATRIPLGPVYFFINESPDSYELSEEVGLASEIGLWVTVSNSSGSTNVGYNNSGPGSGFSYQTMADYYNGPYDIDTDPEMDRDEFNLIMRNARDNSEVSSANQ